MALFFVSLHYSCKILAHNSSTFAASNENRIMNKSSTSYLFECYIWLINTIARGPITRAAIDDYNMINEPEMIDFENDICYYSDNHGNLYRLEF